MCVVRRRHGGATAHLHVQSVPFEIGELRFAAAEEVLPTPVFELDGAMHLLVLGGQAVADEALADDISPVFFAWVAVHVVSVPEAASKLARDRGPALLHLHAVAVGLALRVELAQVRITLRVRENPSAFAEQLAGVHAATEFDRQLNARQARAYTQMHGGRCAAVCSICRTVVRNWRGMGRAAWVKASCKRANANLRCRPWLGCDALGLGCELRLAVLQQYGVSARPIVE